MIISDIQTSRPGQGTTETLWERRITLSDGQTHVFRWSSEKPCELPQWVPKCPKSLVFAYYTSTGSGSLKDFSSKYAEALKALKVDLKNIKCKRCKGRGEIESQKYASTRKGKRWLPCPVCRSRKKTNDKTRRLR